MNNLFEDIPTSVPSEIFEEIVTTQNLRIERIISHGQSSPEQGWYDQDENEWVVVLSGFGVIEFEDGREVILSKGEYLHINSHEKHKVTATSLEEVTVWLAIFYV
ncbi:cupin domain-containing protein [Aliivibrio finisterrensis]|uniref:Cupin domain-containing protein n=1 Tax=Aliivibrio finisterrensis TaxID=511998 RepID=A0A6N6RT65_9GAMM|nr:cupin domain-containing protein [Aliivibrio finisterrensis]KAB2824735.1 cupin domain-containing protein [Aliivibrio finisterrensis]